MSRRAGFTLIELLVVLAIVATLLLVAVPRYFSSHGRAKEAVLKENLYQTRDAIGKYYADKGKYPESIEALVSEKYLLVYRKGLRKDLAAYTTGTPPHVQGARKSAESPGRLIAYVMTVAGPEPLDRIGSPIDREHYVDKQVRPVAEPVLGALGLEFDRVIGDERQIGLF